MNANQVRRNILVSLITLGATVVSVQAAEPRDPIILAGGSVLDRASIAKVDRMERSATVVRDTAEAATHRSVELQYVVRSNHHRGQKCRD